MNRREAQALARTITRDYPFIAVAPPVCSPQGSYYLSCLDAHTKIPFRIHHPAYWDQLKRSLARATPAG